MTTPDDDTTAAVKRATRTPLPKRFYTNVEVVGAASGFGIALDGKPVRTPGRAPLAVPSRNLADGLAAEWSAQQTIIDPASMPLTRVVNSAVDGVVGHEREIAADIAKYAGSDLVCYRAEAPAKLVALQARHWDPVLAWADSALGCRFVVTTGIRHVPQPPDTLARVAGLLDGMDGFKLAGLHSMTTLMGSVLLALAVERGQCDAATAWAAAHVDEDWQISQWGSDAEAEARRASRWRDLQAAALLAAGG